MYDIGKNNADKLTKGRQAKAEGTGHAKLTADQVREIRVSTETNATLARRYRVYPSAIWKVRARRSWKHI